MKKTVSINISGIIFHIDDDAYERLSRYLNSIKRHFSKMEGRDEIIADIEGRIAEVLQEKLKDNKQVISIGDIDEVVKLMGEPYEMDDENEHEPAEEYRTYTYRKPKRLYRDPDDRMIAGVAGGLAAYFNIDPVWVRVLFVVSLFISGAGLIAYIILWIVVPEARTTAEKLEMRGEPVNISNIERSVREEFENMKGKFNEFTNGAKETFKKKSAGRSTFFDRLIAFIGSFFRVLFRIIVILIGIFLILSGLGFITTLVVGVSGLSSFSFFDHGQWIGFSLYEFLTMIFSTDLMSILAVIAALLLAGIPLIMIIYLGFRMLLGQRARIPYLGITAFSFWFAGLVLALIVAVNTGMDFRHSARITKTYELDIPDSGAVCFSASHGRFFDAEQGAVTLFDGEYMAVMGDGGSTIFQVPYIEFRRSTTGTAVITQMAYAKGRNHERARRRAEALRYSIVATDTSFILADHYFFPADAAIRGQKVRLIIEIPEGRLVYFDKNMRTLFRKNPNWSIRRMEPDDKYWVMTPSGLKPLKE